MSISDAFPSTVTVVKDRPAPVAEAETSQRIAPTVEAAPVPAVRPWPVRAKDAVTADFRDAWLWDANGITVRNLWDARIPDLDAVPGANRALRIAWCVYNHAALAVLAPLLFAVWVLSHPARLFYAAPVAVPLTLLWLI